MCGIAGLLSLHSGRSPETATLRAMIATLAHRGPDQNGIRVDGPCGLAHARLSIVDIAGGAQPMCNDAGLAITFNGEIFNHVELRAELAALGHVFKSNSDTEVILQAYAAWGDACLERFNGQWAFALWDPLRKRLFCARDRFGVRPFFHGVIDGSFVFASEAKALFAAGVPCSLDVKALNEIATFWCPVAPRTAWQGVRELPPGSTLVIEDGNVTVRRWWSLDFSEDDALSDRDDCAEALLAALDAAARLRLRADVPVAAYVSGGLDSAVIAALGARRAPLETFSLAFDDPALDESAAQAAVVAAVSAGRHHALRCSHDAAGAAFFDAVAHLETPVIRTAPAPMMQLAGLVHDAGTKVVLTGEGADEVLGGYDIFKEAKIRRFIASSPTSSSRALLLRRLYPYLASIQAQSTGYLRGFFAREGDADLDDPFFSHRPRWRLTQQLRGLFSDDVNATLKNHDPIEELRARLPAAFASWDPLARAQWLESTVLLPGYILSSQGDRMAMARSVEGRYPFLDKDVVALASRMPARVKMRGLDEKHVLKRAARDLVPAEIRARKKQPYRAPDAAAFFSREQGARFPWVEEALAPERVRACGLFDVDGVRRVVDKARRGAAVSARDNMAFVFVLSTLLLVDRFAAS